MRGLRQKCIEERRAQGEQMIYFILVLIFLMALAHFIDGNVERRSATAHLQALSNQIDGVEQAQPKVEKLNQRYTPVSFKSGNSDI